MPSIARLALAALLLLPLACSELVEVPASAAAGCEEATDGLRAEGDDMLPGRACLSCHTEGGAAEDEPLAAAGTVFEKTQTSCNAGGARDVVVELLLADGKTVQATAHTGASGNFHLGEKTKLTFPLKARITKGGVTREMQGAVDSGNCASCHNGTTQARIHLD